MNCRFLIIASVLGVGCQSAPKNVSNPLPIASSPVVVQKKGLKTLQDIKPVSSKIADVKGSTDPVFVPQNNFKIKENSRNTSGSLYSPTSVSSNFLLDNMPIGVGSSVTLFVKEVRAKSDSAASETIAEEDSDALTAELLKGLPLLQPEDGSNKKVITKIKAKVVERLENGDLVVEAQRSSEGVSGRNSVFFRATVPSDRLKKSNTAEITDLADVVFQEVGPNGVMDRKSSGWEDEYSLRFSGFVESPSRLASKLDGDRKSLISMRNRFENRLKSFKNEREKIAKEREDLFADNGEMRDRMKANEELMAKNNEEMKELKDTLAEREEKIKDLEKDLKELEEGKSKEAEPEVASEGETNE